jgi:hypothetical protein
MAIRVTTRRRTTLVVTAAVASVLTAATVAGAHQGTDGANLLHGCVDNGSGLLRVVSTTSGDCRRNETPVHWPLESGDADELAEFIQRLLDSDNPEDLVHWNNMAGVPESLADALSSWPADGEISYDEITGVLTLAAGSVDGGTVRVGTLTSADISEDSIISADIANGTLTGGDVEDGTLTAGDLAGSYNPSAVIAGAVTSEKIFDGTVERAISRTGPSRRTR